MFVGICGGICAGKSSIASYLVTNHSFKLVRLARTSATPAIEKSASDTHSPYPVPSADEPYFDDVDSLLLFVTQRWQEHWVTTDIWDESIVDKLLMRPFFLLVSVDAPVSVRWERFTSRCTAHALTPPTLEDFVLRNDNHLYAPSTGLAPLLSRAQLRLLNSTTSLSSMHDALRELNLVDPTRLRPAWDHYFMTLSTLAAQRSNCMKRRVGCVLTQNNRIISTGYNGTPRGVRNCNEGGCPRCNDALGQGQGLDTCLCIHAEENALLEAGRGRVGEGTVLYCNTCPCLTCCVKITQCGIAEVVFSQGYSMDQTARSIFKEGGVSLRQFSTPRDGLVELSTSSL